jgi:hypothetical protein
MVQESFSSTPRQAWGRASAANPLLQADAV